MQYGIYYQEPTQEELREDARNEMLQSISTYLLGGSLIVFGIVATIYFVVTYLH